MGREIRRVPLNFDWPRRKVWKGFVNPHYVHRRMCPFCDGEGLNEQSLALYRKRRDEVDVCSREYNNLYKNVQAEAQAAGFWGFCEFCGGESDVWLSPAHKKQYHDWEETPVPEGEGWQVWETVSAGAPITPVFPTAEALVEYLVQTGSDWDGPVSREAAEAFVRDGWVPSAVGIKGVGYVTGIEAAKLFDKKEE